MSLPVLKPTYPKVILRVKNGERNAMKILALAALLWNFSTCWAQGGLPASANRASGVPHADSKTFRILRPGTMSIIARDPQTGELGVAVGSHFFSVGPVCAWAKSGVGAVANQAITERMYGKIELGVSQS